MPTTDQLLGPLGLTLVLLVVGVYAGRLIVRFVWQLWTLHLAGDEKKDATNDVLINSLPDIADSLKTLTKVVEERLVVPEKPK